MQRVTTCQSVYHFEHYYRTSTAVSARVNLEEPCPQLRRADDLYLTLHTPHSYACRCKRDLEEPCRQLRRADDLELRPWVEQHLQLT